MSTEAPTAVNQEPTVNIMGLEKDDSMSLRYIKFQGLY
jgi:hypothetical protein